MKRVRVEFRWAIFFIIMQILWMIMEKLTGLHDEHIDKHPIFTNLVAIPAIAFYFFALLDKRRNVYEGSMTYWQGFRTGIIMSLFITVLTPFVIYLSVEIISPDYFENAIAYSVENDISSKEEAKAYFDLGSYLKQGMLFAPIIGIVTSAIVAAFTRKQKE